MADVFWRFPVALLGTYPGYERDALDTILSHCLWTVGGLETPRRVSDDEALDYGQTHGWKAENNPDHFRILRGAMVLGVNNGVCEFNLETALDAEAFLKTAGNAAMNTVTVSNEWFWRVLYTTRSAHDKLEENSWRPLSWRDFRFLCAILSKVGKQKFHKVGWREIQARAAGWCGKAAMSKASPDEIKRRQPLILTQDQIRATRDKLESSDFFCRVVWRTGQGRGGESWYSFSCGKGKDGRERLVNWVAGKKTRRKSYCDEKRAADSSLIMVALERRRSYQTLNGKDVSPKVYFPKYYPKH